MAEMYISNTIVNDSGSGTVAYARQIHDEEQDKKQGDINKELLEKVSALEAGGGSGDTTALQKRVSELEAEVAELKANQPAAIPTEKIENETITI